jgi:periplasmic divalent cation tolerance protein
LKWAAGRRFGIVSFGIVSNGLLGGAAPERRTNGMETNQRVVFVYTTYPSIVEAEEAGRALVERRLCACVNILPGMVSLYWWQGKVERGEEVVMIIKTRATLAERVRAAVKAMHSYTTPAILVLPVEGIDPGYRVWLMAETEDVQTAEE